MLRSGRPDRDPHSLRTRLPAHVSLTRRGTWSICRCCRGWMPAGVTAKGLASQALASERTKRAESSRPGLVQPCRTSRACPSCFCRCVPHRAAAAHPCSPKQIKVSPDHLCECACLLLVEEERRRRWELEAHWPIRRFVPCTRFPHLRASLASGCKGKQEVSVRQMRCSALWRAGDAQGKGGGQCLRHWWKIGRSKEKRERSNRPLQQGVLLTWLARFENVEGDRSRHTLAWKTPFFQNYVQVVSHVERQLLRRRVDIEFGCFFLRVMLGTGIRPSSLA